MNQNIINLICKSHPHIRELIDKFNLEVVDCFYIKGFEIDHNRLIIWHFGTEVTDKELCNILLQHPQIDTIFLGKTVTENNDGRQIRCIHNFLTASHNIVPIIKNIQLEDDKKYYVVDGMLIDRETCSVIDYASGRENKKLHIPDGVIELKEHCFTYNRFVSEVEIPTSLRFFKGITSLPNLKHITFHGDEISLFTINNDILYEEKAGFNAITFIPPYHNTYKPALQIKVLLNDLYQLIHDKAEQGRWQDVLAENFEYNEEYDRIWIRYYGGFYEQEWYIVYEEFPTKICIGYSLWEHWKDNCYSIPDNRKDVIDMEYNDCRECSAWNNCQFIHISNSAYMNKLWTTMKEIIDESYIVEEDGYGYICLDLTQHPSYINKIALSFLDVALHLRNVYRIGGNDSQSLMRLDKQNGIDISRFPFDYRYNNNSLGYVRPDNIAEDNPPF